MKNCVMCNQQFEEKDLDFIGRCEPCFHKFVDTPENERPNIGVPYSPIYNGKAKYGF